MSDFNNKDNNSSKWDENNSFYKWKIHLTNGKIFTGYSKSKDKPEVHNKVNLFCRKIIMIKNKGYFDPSRPEKMGKLKYLEIYKRTGLREYNEKLCYMYLDSYVLCENHHFNTNVTVEKFLKHFYNLIKLGKISELDYSYVNYSNMEHEEEHAFKLIAGRFKTEMELHEYSKQLILNNMFPEQRILHFVRQYREQYLINPAESGKRTQGTQQNISINFAKPL